EAADDGAVDDDGTVLRVVGADVFQIEVLRLLVIELDRRALPLAADRVRHVEVDLRPVERAVAVVDREREPGALHRVLQLRFGVAPRRFLAEMVLGHRRQLRRVGQAEIAVYALHETNQALDLLADLLRRDETVRVVLRELAYAREAREHAGELVAVQRRLLV